MRKTLIAIGILLLGLTATAYAQTNDAPHNVTNSINCSDCHAVATACTDCHNNVIGSGYTKNSAMGVQTHSSANTSEKYGVWERTCIDCHFRQTTGIHGQLQRIDFATETYLVTGTITSVTTNLDGTRTYGYNPATLVVNNPAWADPAKWGKKSANASNPPGNERGLIFYKTPPALTPIASEIKSATANTITVTGNPGTVTVGNSFAIIYGQFIRTTIGDKSVKFFTNTGANSFAYDESLTGTDPTPDGVCQVCHTQTTAWKADGTLAGVGVHAGQNGANCMTCHKHEEGFKAAGCNTCHGFPPINDVASGGPNGLVNSPATGSTTAGEHDTHVNTVGIACGSCHYNSVGTGLTHNDGTVQAITMGFYLFSGAVQGGTYNGQSGVEYNTSVPNTGPATSVVSPGSGAKQCSNIYCHSTGQGANGGALAGGDYKTPQWDGTVVCGDCHRGEGNGNLMNSGSHTPHFTSLIRTDCDNCHNGFGSGSAQHVNNSIGVATQANPGGGSGSYTGGTTPGNHAPGGGYGSCSNVYCHSPVQKNNGAQLEAADYKTVTWGNTNSVSCGDCHGNVALNTGSHTKHLDIPYECYNCHDTAGDNTDKHANRNIDIIFRNGGAYSQVPNTPGNGYGNCSTTLCHGTTSPQWGTDMSAVTTCEKCHGSANTAQTVGTFKATSGATAPTDAKVGAHVAHLASTHNFSVDIACTQCHASPASVTAAGHIDTALPAELSWGSLATKGGAVSPNYSGGSCSTVYCHGNGIKNNWPGATGLTPVWNDTAYLSGSTAQKCSKCHGYPPGGGHTELTNCAQCHNHVNPTNDGFIDPTKHVNMAVESADNCTGAAGCHTNANLSATHAKHVDADTVLAGKSVGAGDYGQAWFYGVAYTNGAPKYACGYCHPNTSATHMNGVKNLNIDPNDAAAAGTVKAKNGYPDYTQNPGVSVTCSSVYCHSTGYDDGTGYYYQTSPDWYATDPWALVDKCAQCHGNSPNTSGKTGSLSHYNPNAMGMGVVGGHFVGIHYKNVFTGTSGVIKDASNRQNAHGTASTSTTINCNTCHQSTVTTSANDQNTICGSCHTNKGSMAIDAASTTHINGTPNVSFEASIINSKAQIRNDITTVTELNNSWTRTDGYKQLATSKDASAVLNTTAAYIPGSKSCSSVACHNGNSVQWGAPNMTCNSCHTSLP